MPSADSGPLSWTLRLKNHKTTILISTAPEASFKAIRQNLLVILNSTYPSKTINGLAIPADAEDIVFALPLDPLDLRKGWTELKPPEQEPEDGGRGRKKKAGGKSSGLDCPQGVGLKDGSALAFKFRVAGKTQNGDEGSDEDLDEMDGVEEAWDVLIPSFEEDGGTQPMAE